ncbi:MAG: hypothetical protein ABJA67_16320 [Chthonomonadales bacterium]
MLQTSRTVIRTAGWAMSLLAVTTVALAFDSSTPKGTAKMFAKAVEAGDGVTAKSLAVGTPTGMKFIEGLAGIAKAQKGLEAAATKKFGKEGASLTKGQTMKIPDTDKSIEKITGDKATLTQPDGKGQPMTLKKVGGKWKVDISAMGKDPKQADAMMTQIGSMFVSMTKAMNDTTTDVNAGKFKTVKEAQAGMQAKMMAVLGGGPGGARPGGAPRK